MRIFNIIYILVPLLYATKPEILFIGKEFEHLAQPMVEALSNQTQTRYNEKVLAQRSGITLSLRCAGSYSALFLSEGAKSTQVCLISHENRSFADTTERLKTSGIVDEILNQAILTRGDALKRKSETCTEPQAKKPRIDDIILPRWHHTI